MRQNRIQNPFGEEITNQKITKLFKNYQENFKNFIFDFSVDVKTLNEQHRIKINYLVNNSKAKTQVVIDYVSDLLKNMSVSYSKIEIIFIENELVILVFGCKPFVKINQILGMISNYAKFYESNTNKMNKPEIESITIHSDNEEKVIKEESVNLPIIGKVFQHSEPLYNSEPKIITPLVIKYDEIEVLKLELNGDVLIKGEKVGNCIEAVKAISLYFKLS